MIQGRLASNILPNSATMIGVCVTAVGLVKIAESHIGPSRVDIYFSLAAIVFLGSAILSYIAVRAEEGSSGSAAIERIADALFLVGLFSMTFIAILFAYEVV